MMMGIPRFDMWRAMSTYRVTTPKEYGERILSRNKKSKKHNGGK